MSRDVSTYPEGYPSVTEILSRTGWTGDFGGISPERLDQLAEVGTYVHACTELIDIAELDLDRAGEQARENVERNRYFGHVENYLRAYMAFRCEISATILASEQTVVHDELHYCGRLDRIVEFADGTRAVVDVKTSQSPSPSWALQLAGYAMAAENGTPLARHALRLMRDGTYRVDTFDSAGDRDLFRAAAITANAQLAAGVWRLNRGGKR